MLKTAIFQVSLLAGTIIGAGIFALPFVFKGAGLSAGFFYLGVGALVYIFIHLMYADLVMRTAGEQRFLGYAQIYLGKGAFWPALLMTIVEMILVLAIYLILSQSFSGLLGVSGSPAGEAGIIPVLIFWFLGSLAIFAGLRRIAFFEFLITGAMIAIIGLIFFFGFKSIGQIEFSNFLPQFKNLLLPLAPILFALSGRVAIPSLVKYSSSKIKISVIIGTLIPAIVYGFFILAVIGLSGEISEDAVSGLVNRVPFWIIILIGIFGLFSLWSSYITIGYDIYRSLLRDLKISKWLGLLLITICPLLIYFFSSWNFIALVSFTGGIFLALEGIFILLMWLRARRLAKQPPILIKKLSPLIILGLFLVFGIALVYEITKSLI